MSEDIRQLIVILDKFLQLERTLCADAPRRAGLVRNLEELRMTIAGRARRMKTMAYLIN
jgi:hypothetical protein